MRHRTKSQHLRQKKLSRAIHLAVVSMSVASGAALADVQLDTGGGAAASALTTITNTATISPADDYLAVGPTQQSPSGGRSRRRTPLTSITLLSAHGDGSPSVMA
jgi:hypothetical protein